MENVIKESFIAEGMSCTGCEGIIEKKLSEFNGVKSVKAVFSKKSVTVEYDPKRIDFGKMRAALNKEGYIIKKTLDMNDVQKKMADNKPLTAFQFIGIVIILLAVYLIISKAGGFNFIPEVSSSMGYGVLFVVGLLTSLHCVAMCGGINMSQCMPKVSTSNGFKDKVKPSLLYNLGRVVSYTIIGGVIGALGSVISFSGWARAIVAVLSGIFMVVMGISMLDIFPWVNKITPRLPRIFREKAGSAGRGKGPFIVGLLNGLMPCGPLQAMQIYALGTGSLIVGALSMFFFSLGTLPLMFGLGAIVTMLGSKLTKNMMKVSAVLVTVLGIVMLGRGLALSGISATSKTVPSDTEIAVTDTVNTSDVATSGNDVQNIESTLTSRGYPDITVKKGVPVVWNLQAESKNINGCNKTLIIPNFDLQVKLQAGDNIIKFTPTETGTITYSCWMGMQTGTIKVVE